MVIYRTGEEETLIWRISYAFPLLMTWHTEFPPPPAPQLPQRLFDVEFGGPLAVGLSTAFAHTTYHSTYAPGVLGLPLAWPVGYCGYPVGIFVEAISPYGGYDVASTETVILPPGTSCEDFIPDPGPWNHAEDVDGLCTFACDCVEVWGEYLPDDAVQIDGVWFSPAGGTPEPDGLPARGDVRYWIPKLGGDLVTTNTANGVTASVTDEITGALNLVSYRASLQATNNVLNTESATLSGTATFDAGFAGGPLPLAANFSKSGGNCEFEWGPDGTWSVTATGVDVYDDTTAVLIAEVAAVTKYKMRGMLRVIGAGPTEAYPDPLTVRLRWKDLQDLDLTLSPELTFEWVQYDWEANAVVDGSSIGAEAHDEVAPVKAFLLDVPDAGQPTLSTRGEDTRDRRLQWRLLPWPAFQVVQTSALAIAAVDLEVTAEAPTITLTETNLEGYRYMEVDYTSPFERTLSLTHGAKEYDFPVTAGSGTAVIDLLFPKNVPPSLKVDERDGRWPLEDGPTSFPDVSTLDDKDKGWLAGPLERASTLSVGGILEGEALIVGPINLIRQTESRMGMFLPFQAERKVWQSETDTTYADFDLSLRSDGRLVGPAPTRFHVVPISSPASYEYFTLTGLKSFIDGTLKGWTATIQAVPAGTPYLESDPSVKILGAHNAAGNIDGYVWDPAAGTEGEWRDQTNLDQGGIFYSGIKSDEFSGWPRDEAWEVNFSKTLRGRSTGNVFKPSGALASVADVVELVKASDATLYGRGSTDAQGSYPTRSPWAPGNVAVRTRLTAKPTIYEASTSANRWPYGPSFIRILVSGVRPSLAARRDGSIFLASVPDDVYELSRAPAGTPTTFDPKRELQMEAKRVSLATGLDIDGPLWVGLIHEAGAADLRATPDLGRSWPTVISLPDCDDLDICRSPEGAIFAFTLEGGTVRGQSYSPTGAVIAAAWDTSVTGLSEEARIAVTSFPKGDSTFGIDLAVKDGATSYVVTSFDGGKNFS